MMKNSTTTVTLDQVPPRKRTQRACDQCRRRRTKCDGENKCKTCKMIGLECSYGVIVKQTRGPAYIAHLENKVKELQAEVDLLQSNMDGSSNNSEANSVSPMISPILSSPVERGADNYSSTPNQQSLVVRPDLHLQPNSDSLPHLVAPFAFSNAPSFDESSTFPEPAAYHDDLDMFNGYHHQSVPYLYSSPTETDFFTQTAAAPAYMWNSPGGPR